MKVTQKFLLLSTLFTIISCSSVDTNVQTHGVPEQPEPIMERLEEVVEPSQAPVEAPESALEEEYVLVGPVYSLYVFPEVDWLEVEKVVVSSSYTWMEDSPKVKLLQEYIGVTADGVYGLGTWGAHRTHAVDLGFINLSYPIPPTNTIIKDGWECPEWMDVARSAGWPEAQLRKLSYVIYRESRCDPNAFNGADPIGGSLGLIQINRYWCTSNIYWPDGYLQVRDSGVTTCNDLYDPYVNLRSGYHIWVTEGGWSPWGL